MAIFVNRTLNMKTIKAIGFDMDYTLVRYHGEAFEDLTYRAMVTKLKDLKKYPDSIGNLRFHYLQCIRGLVLDKKRGNLLKLGHHGKVKKAFHGTQEMSFKDQQEAYRGLVIDLNLPDYAAVDTSFSIAYACLFTQLVELRDQSPLEFPDYATIEANLKEVVDLAHADGTLKSQVVANLDKYIIRDEKLVQVLERFKLYGKQLWVITNSEFHYTKALLDHTINPFLKQHSSWKELFDVVITLATKPRFFTDKLPFLEVDPDTGLMKNSQGPYHKGIYQGGCASTLQQNAALDGEQILYIGDHIYGDVLSIKKTCNWRTALVIEELSHEISASQDAQEVVDQIDKLMEEKIEIENQLDELYAREFEKKEKIEKEKVHELFDKIEKLDKSLAKLLKAHQRFFNPTWGEIMRAGQEPSRFAGQIEKYACIYMSKVSDLEEYGPRKYFRSAKKSLPHEKTTLVY